MIEDAVNHELQSAWQESLVEADLIELFLHPLSALRDTVMGDPIDEDTRAQLQALEGILIEKGSSAQKGLQEFFGPHWQIDILGDSLMPRVIDGGDEYILWPDYWAQLKKEFHTFLCTHDKKYNSLRRKLATTADKTQTTIVSTIAAVMAAQFGVAAGLLVPFCAICLVVLVRLGKEAFCSTIKWDLPLTSRTTEGSE